MDYSFNDLKNAASLIQKSVFGKKKEYQLKFNHEDDDRWYVDFPDWPFDHHNLMMVAGADDLCAFYDKLARGMSFKKAMSEEDYFVDDNEDA